MSATVFAKFIVVFLAIPLCHVASAFASGESALIMSRLNPVKPQVFGVGGNEDKIFDLVVVFNAVYMVYNFAFFKIPSNVLFHHKSVLKNLVSTSKIRVARAMHQNISRRSFVPLLELRVEAWVFLSKNFVAFSASFGYWASSFGAAVNTFSSYHTNQSYHGSGCVSKPKCQ